MTEISRREALGMFVAAGATAGFAGGATARMLQPAAGWDAAMGEFVLPDLPYAQDALEPHIDAETMGIHHGKHHAGYVRGLNKALGQLDAIRRGEGDPATVQHWQRQLSFHAGGHLNHSLFWTGMAPEGAGGGGEPAGKLAAAIDRDFGSFEKFSAAFQLAAKTVEGSGWGWLVYEPLSGRLMVSQMQNQQDMLFAGAVPLLGVDVWEHAYYLKYRNRRAAYLASFMKVINWGEIARRFEAAIG